MMGMNTSSIKAYFVTERADVKEIRLIPAEHTNFNRNYADLQNNTYSILKIQKPQKVNVYEKPSPLVAFFSVGGYPLLGSFDAKPGRFYEIRYCKSGLFWKAVVREIAPF